MKMKSWLELREENQKLKENLIYVTAALIGVAVGLIELSTGLDIPAETVVPENISIKVIQHVMEEM